MSGVYAMNASQHGEKVIITMTKDGVVLAWIEFNEDQIDRAIDMLIDHRDILKRRLAEMGHGEDP